MQRKDDLLRRPLYLYSLPAEVLDTLVPKDVTDAALSETRTRTPAPSEATDTADLTGATDGAESTASTSLSGQACTLCGLSFATAADQRGHLKSDLHHYNLKQKMRSLPPVTETEFEQLVGNLDESLSGSDWSSSESELEESSSQVSSSTNVLATLLKKQAVLAEKQRSSQRNMTHDGEDDVEASSGRGLRSSKDRNAAAAAAASIQPFVWFSSSILPENTYFGIYRAMFMPEELGQGEGSKEASPDVVAAIRSRQLAPISGAVTSTPTTYTGRHIFLCMIGGGHFAAMVVALAPRRVKAGSLPMNREATVLAHKTFHRYTTRRKQGGSQSANDNAKGAAHSAGSSLRRYNEQALVEDVRLLLQDWKRLLDTADLLFVRATGTTNQRTLFGPYEGQVLNSRDPRLRGFPFNTRRPTQNEIMRAFIELTRLKVREIVPAAAAPAAASSASAPASSLHEAAPKQPKYTEEEETALLHTQQLQALARRSKVPALLAYLKTNGLSAAAFRFFPPDVPQHHHAPTLLHLAASQNAPALVSGLLLRAGADPAVRNGDGKTPFELAGDRPTRDAFRVARSELTAKSDDAKTIDWDAARVPAPLTRAEAEQRDAREKEEAARKEAERRRAEEARLKAAGPGSETSTAASSRKKAAPAGVAKSAQEIREEEARGLTPEQRQRLERERRARAAEERIRRMQQGS